MTSFDGGRRACTEAVTSAAFSQIPGVFLHYSVLSVCASDWPSVLSVLVSIYNVTHHDGVVTLSDIDAGKIHSATRVITSGGDSVRMRYPCGGILILKLSVTTRRGTLPMPGRGTYSTMMTYRRHPEFIVLAF